MFKLTATYSVPLSNSLRLQRDPADQLEYSVVLGEFEVAVRIINEARSLIEEPGKLPITSAKLLEVSVSRLEDEDPPPLLLTDSGGRDFSERTKWMQSRYHEYQEAALIVANRVVRFFKYVQRTPQLKEFRKYANEFNNQHWTDASGHDIEPGIYQLTALMASPEGPQLLGQRSFTVNDDNALRCELETEQQPTAAEEFLSEAQTSISDQNYRRAVLEMAIGCEVAIKQAFFRASTPAGSAFEALEDDRKIHVRAIDLLHRPALEAFSASFRDEHSVEYQHLDYLFRCRNKVAHRATAQYRDRAGIMQSVNRNTLEQWWQSIETLFRWLQMHIGRRP